MPTNNINAASGGGNNNQQSSSINAAENNNQNQQNQDQQQNQDNQQGQQQEGQQEGQGQENQQNEGESGTEQVGKKKKAKKPKKKKKKHVGLIVTLVLVFVLIVLPLGFIFGFLFDTSTKKTNVDPNVTEISQIGTNVMVDSLDPAKMENKAKLAITEQDFDQILYVAQQKINGGFAKYLKKMYTKINFPNYTFYVDVEVPMFKTRLGLNARMDNTDPTVMKLKIKDVSIGRLHVSMGFVKKFVNLDLGTMFQDAGLPNFTFDQATNTFIYPINGMISDLSNLMGTGELGFLKDLLDELSALNLITVGNQKDALSLDINLASLKASESPYYSSTYHHDYSTEIDNQILTQLKAELKSGAMNEGNLENEFKTRFQNNFVTASNTSLKDNVEQSVQDQATKYPLGQEIVVEINEADLNDYLNSMSYLGTAYTFSRKVGTDYKINYITFDNLYSQMSSQKLAFVLGLNINGMMGAMSFKADQQTSSFGQLALNINEIKLGNTAVGNTFQEVVFSFVKSALESGGETLFNIDNNRNINFDFVTPIQQGIDSVFPGVYQINSTNTRIEPALTNGKLSITIQKL